MTRVAVLALAAAACTASASSRGQRPPPIEEALRSSDPYERARALQVLGAGREPGFAFLAREALREDDAPIVQCRALQALGRLRDRASVPAVSAKLSSPYKSVRAFAAWSLGEIGEPASLGILLPVLRADEDADVLGFALEALSKLGGAKDQAKALPFLRHADARLRDAAAQTLGAIGDEGSVGDLFAQLDRETELQVQRSIAAAVGRIGGAYAARQLAHMLKDARAPLRQRMAAEALQEMGAEGAMALAEVLGEPEDPEVHALAARTLGDMGFGLANRELLGLLEAEDPRPRLAAVYALARTGGAEAIPALEAAASSSAGWIRRVALEAAESIRKREGGRP